MPKQSARLILVNDVNFLLYTPFLPEAAAGTLEPRHVVTPLRDILRRTNLRLGADLRARPGGANGRAPRPTRARPRRCATTSCWSRVGSVSRSLPIPGLDEHAIGFKSLADAIWLRNHVIETLEQANATEDPARREELLTYVFVGGGYSGLEALAELQDFAADAMDRYPRARLHGMRWILVEATDRVLPEVAARPRRVRAARAARARDRHPPRDPARGGGRRQRRCSRPASGSRPGRWSGPPASQPHPSLASLSLPLDERRPGEGRRAHAGRGPERGLGDRRLRRGPAPGGGGRPCPPTARRPSARGRRSPTTSPPSSASRPGRGGSATRAARRSSTSAATRRSARSGGLKFRGFVAWWMARTYHMSQIPGLARKIRAVVDWTVGLPFRARHRRGRLDRPSAPAARRGLRPRRHPPPARLRLRRNARFASAPAVSRSDGRRRLRPDRAHLRARDRDRRPREGQLVLDLVRGRRRAAAASA